MRRWCAPSMASRRALLLTLIFGVSSARAENGEVEANTATQAQLESLPGVGPQLAERLLKARPFADWADLRHRVKGVGEPTARKLSAAGLRVKGQAFFVSAPTHSG